MVSRACLASRNRCQLRSLFSLYWFAGAIEFAGGALLLLGLATRAAAFVMSGEMAFAYFISHAPHSFFPILNRGDSAILYCFVFLYFVFAGGGPLSLDAWLSRRRRQCGAEACGVVQTLWASIVDQAKPAGLPAGFFNFVARFCRQSRC